MRIRDLIKDRLIDPDFGPADVAAEAGMSLRYVHRFGHVPRRSIYTY
jgi:AraC-like DNA-binding protein